MNDDLISRAEVINAIKHLTIKGSSINAADIISVLFQLPSAEQERTERSADDGNS